MGYRFRCRKCGFEITVATLNKGAPIPCDGCGEVVIVPKHAEVHGDVQVPTPEPVRHRPPSLTPGEPSGFLPMLPGVLNLLGILHLAGGLIVGIDAASENGWRGVAIILMTTLWSLALFGFAQLTKLLVRMERQLRDVLHPTTPE